MEFKKVEDYPIFLKAKHIQEILGVSQRHAYEIMELKDFPLIRMGRNKRVNRDEFFSWVNKYKVS
ncbi:helix-turn-helix domain-containing protein [Alkalihalobacillus trypoxylicola]|uniref:Excisionase n=1 Tax=Alkalihalobacillus trypoxylicola TaxID=519424 RepID=A0A161P9D7_9BACI|nr:helix-turn-helix domain-containing protein [Alkalihalobacillus trypoxylicola]KYG28134.1 excisionase [Alkalihalobacillus trypoxylicola]